MLKRLLPFFALLAYSGVMAQDIATDSSTAQKAAHNAVTSYHLYIDKQSRLYNGIEYYGYSPLIEGHPYFRENTWQRAHIVYDGIAYDTVQMMYDIVKDRVVILHYNNFFRVALFGEKVSTFTVMGHRFIRLEHDSLKNSVPVTGFYDHLYTGEIAVVARRGKFIEETVKETVERKFLLQDQFYIRKGGIYHIIRTRSALLAVLKDHSREVKQHLRRKKIKFRKDKENAIVQAASFYDSLKK
jgi:hypothetical protein